jgi:hypothetical protein
LLFIIKLKENFIKLIKQSIMEDLARQRVACVADNDAILLLLFVRVLPPDKLSTARIKHKM